MTDTGNTSDVTSRKLSIEVAVSATVPHNIYKDIVRMAYPFPCDVCSATIISRESGEEHCALHKVRIRLWSVSNSNITQSQCISLDKKVHQRRDMRVVHVDDESGQPSRKRKRLSEMVKCPEDYCDTWWDSIRDANRHRFTRMSRKWPSNRTES